MFIEAHLHGHARIQSIERYTQIQVIRMERQTESEIESVLHGF